MDPIIHRRFVKACVITISWWLLCERQVVNAQYVPPSNNRTDIILNTNGWKFILSDVPAATNVVFDDSSWTPISIPHTWNNLDGQDGGNNYYRGIGWYRVHCTRMLPLPIANSS